MVVFCGQKTIDAIMPLTVFCAHLLCLFIAAQTLVLCSESIRAENIMKEKQSEQEFDAPIVLSSNVK